MKRRAEVRQKRDLSKLGPEARARREQIDIERERAVKQITESNAFGQAVLALERLLGHLSSSDDMLARVEELLVQLRARRDESMLAKEQAIALVCRLEEEARNLDVAEELARYPQQNRERAATLMAEEWAEIMAVQSALPTEDLAKLGGRVFRLRFDLDTAQRNSDAKTADAARKALAVLEPAMEAGDRLRADTQREVTRIKARFRRKLRGLRASPSD